MKIKNVVIALSLSVACIASCKKEKPEENSGGGTPPATTNYYVFDGTTYTGNLGWSASPLFMFFCSNAVGGGGDKELQIYFKDYTNGIDPEPPAGIYSIINDPFYLDSVTCAIQVINGGNTYYSQNSGTITIGKSGSKTTYLFNNIPLDSAKTVSGNFAF